MKEPEEKQRHTKYRFLRRLQRLVEDLEFRIRDGNRRIELPNPGDIQAAEKAAKHLISVNAEIEQSYARMEKLGKEGKVVESKALMNIVKELERTRDGLKKKVDAGKLPDDSDRSSAPNGVAPLGDGREKRMRVCDTCGALLVINDAVNRVESHLEGKQHVGYSRIRATIEELKKINFTPDDMRPPSSRPPQRDDRSSSRRRRHRSSRDRSNSRSRRHRSSRDRSSRRRRRRSRSSSTKNDDDDGDSPEDDTAGGDDSTGSGSDKDDSEGDKKSRHRSSKRRRSRSRSRDRHRSSRHRSSRDRHHRRSRHHSRRSRSRSRDRRRRRRSRS